MDLAGLMERVPPLLDACVSEKIDALQNLRLVSKDASRVALLDLRSYTLTLKGFEGYKNVSGASMLQHTHLQNLSVHLLLSGGFQAGDIVYNCITKLGSHPPARL